MINKQIIIAFALIGLATLAMGSGCPFQKKDQTAQPKEPANGSPFVDLFHTGMHPHHKKDETAQPKDLANGCPFVGLFQSEKRTSHYGSNSKCPFYQLFAKCPFSDYLKKNSVVGDGKCAFTEYVKSFPLGNGSASKCPFYDLTMRCPLYNQLKSKLESGGALKNCPLYKKFTLCPILKEMVQNKSLSADGKCPFAEIMKMIQPSGGENNKCPFYELFSKCPIYKRMKMTSVAGDGHCPIYSDAETTSLVNSKCPLFQLFKKPEQPSMPKKLSPAKLCPVYTVFGKCPVTNIIKSAVRNDGKCAFIDYVKQVQPTGGNFSKCPYYELAAKCTLFKDIIPKLTRASLAKCPYYQKFAKCPLYEYLKSNKFLGAEGKCPFVEYMKIKQPSGGQASGCPVYELFSKCPLYQNVKSGLSVLGDGNCPFSGLTKTVLDAARKSNCPIFKYFKGITFSSHLKKCPFYGNYKNCPLSSIIREATKGDGKCVLVEYVKSMQSSGDSNIKCPFYAILSKFPWYDKLKSLNLTEAAAKCPFYKLVTQSKCPLAALIMKDNSSAADGKCAFIELLNSLQPSGGSVSKCPFYELFGKCPLYDLIINRSYVSGDGKCMFIEYVKMVSIRKPLLGLEVQALKESWKILKLRSNLAPNVFLDYFKEKPESQNLFPELANLTLIDLPTDRTFLHRVYTCFASLNRIIAHIGNKDSSSVGCPATMAGLRGKYNERDVELFGRVFLGGIQRELGEDFTGTVEKAWAKAINAMKAYLLSPK